MKRALLSSVIALHCFAHTPCRGAEATCATCHRTQFDTLARSVHGALRCQECHHGDETYALDASELQKFLPTAPAAANTTFDHGPSFTGTPARRDIPSLCGDCHADVERINPYGLRTDQLTRYRTSGHGKTLISGDDRVAVCTDCHGTHDVLGARNTESRTHPLNVPDTCARCHSDEALMTQFGLPVAVVDEYRASVHGRLIVEQRDTGAPTCATCHGAHASVPPGYARAGAVCARCHANSAARFGESVHATLDEFRGCVQCHGGGAGRHFHFIQRIAQKPERIIRSYAMRLSAETTAGTETKVRPVRPEPRAIIHHAMESCLECHDEPEDDESLAAMFTTLDDIAAAEAMFARTGWRLDQVGRGMLLVEDQRFVFEDAKTHLIGIAPLQHALNADAVHAEIAELTEVCDRVNAELDDLEAGLELRFRLLVPIWLFAGTFAAALYVKYKRLKAEYVMPMADSEGNEG